MAVNKVVKSDGTTLIDLTGDTVTSASHIMSGYIGHLADGTQVTGTGQGVSSGYQTYTVTVEIGENSVSNALALYNYFLPYFEGAVALLGIVMQESTYTVNNQFVSYLYGVDTGYEHRTIRRRNNADNEFRWRANNYDAYLVAGTHYTVTFVK